MDIQSTIYFQIATDVGLCLSIAVLVFYLRKNAHNDKTAVVDEQSLLQFKELLAGSQKEAERFIRIIDECYRRFKELAIDMEVREERLKVLIEEAKKRMIMSEIPEHARDEQTSKHKYEEIMKCLEEGIPLEEIAERTGITSGEILLIADLEKVRQGKAKQRNENSPPAVEM